MSKAETASTSYGLTARSKSWPDVVRLGQQIVTQLGLDESTDTLARWMAHQVAEAITRGEKGRRRDKDAAIELILELWRHRTSWPDGWPPAEAESFRRGLRDDRYGERSGSSSTDVPNPWLARIGNLSELHREEYEVWRRLAFAEASLESELTQWSQEYLDEEEKSFLTSLLTAQMEATSKFSEQAGKESTAEERVQIARQELRKLGYRRGLLFRQATAELKEHLATARRHRTEERG